MAVYLDHNATTAFDSRVLEAMMPHLTKHHGKPSSVHRYGRIAPSTGAREQIADAVNAHPGQVIFNGAQAGNFAIKGVAARAAPLHQWRRVSGRAIG